MFSGKSFDGLKENVQLMPCKKLPCRLKKGTATNITIHFTPGQYIITFIRLMASKTLNYTVQDSTNIARGVGNYNYIFFNINFIFQLCKVSKSNID